jgi:hypothetical protein
MLEWIIANKDWLFSGVAVAVPLAIIGWWWSSRKSKAGKTSTYSVHQSNSGGGDNVIGDKISHKE